VDPVAGWKHACVQALRNGNVDAVATDTVILAGYAAQYPGTTKVVGQPFSVDMFGIGLAKDNSELHEKSITRFRR
jgi:glutamate transport system substrate-binding protein